MDEKNYMLPVRRKWVWCSEKDAAGNEQDRNGPLMKRYGAPAAHLIWESVSKAARRAAGCTGQYSRRDGTEEQRRLARDLAERMLTVLCEDEDTWEAEMRALAEIKTARRVLDDNRNVLEKCQGALAGLFRNLWNAEEELSRAKTVCEQLTELSEAGEREAAEARKILSCAGGKRAAALSEPGRYGRVVVFPTERQAETAFAAIGAVTKEETYEH